MSVGWSVGPLVGPSVRPLVTLLFFRRLEATYGRVHANEKNWRTRIQKFIRMGGGRAVVSRTKECCLLFWIGETEQFFLRHLPVEHLKLGGLKKATFSCFICDHLTLRAHNIWTVRPILMFKTLILSVFHGLQLRKKIYRFSKYTNGDVAIDSLTRVTDKWTK